MKKHATLAVMNEYITLSEPPCSSYEGFLQQSWNAVPLNTRFRDTHDREVVVLSRGTWNMESGPDFKNARIRIAGALLKGDVEIHVRRSDWDRHSHSGNPAYAGVILHVVQDNDSCVRDDLPTLVLPSGKKIAEAPRPETVPYGDCADHFEHMEQEELVRFFKDAGLDRIREKALALLENMIKEGVRPAFLRKLFEQMGTKKNRAAMNAVYTAVSGKYPATVFLQSFEPVIWGESGLLPSDHANIQDPVASELVRDLWKKWWSLRPDSSQKPEWKRDGTRPLNSPEREIAAVVAILRKTGCDPVPVWAEHLMSSPDAEAFVRELTSSFITEDPFWDHHTSFTALPMEKTAHVVGESRANVLAVDVAIPCLSAYARLKKDHRLLDRVNLAASMLPKTAENRITKDAFIRWFKSPDEAKKIFNDACSRQGILHVYKQYCAAVGGNCSACLIRNSFHE